MVINGIDIDLSRNPYRGVLTELARECEPPITVQAIRDKILKGNVEMQMRFAEKLAERRQKQAAVHAQLRAATR